MTDPKADDLAEAEGTESTETTDDTELTESAAAEGGADETAEAVAEALPEHPVDWARIVAFGILPGLTLILATAAGYLMWQDNSVRDGDLARIESVQVAKDSTVALLSYQPDTVEQQLTAARDLLTGKYRDSYTSLTHEVVIPGAKQKQISAVATVPAAASVSADARHAVVLVFVNQTVVVGTGAPSATTSSVRVALEKVGDRWLISAFEQM